MYRCETRLYLQRSLFDLLNKDTHLHSSSPFSMITACLLLTVRSISRRIGSAFTVFSLMRFLTTIENSFSNSETYSNQDIVTSSSKSLEDLEKKFNSKSIKYSFGYGLGVFAQEGYEKSANKPQIDVLHVVDNPTEFHTSNISQHPEHYSFVKRLGVSAVVKVETYGAGVYYNPYVSINDKNGNENMIKYGIVSKEVIFKDLTEWSSFYLAGRLQKPVRHIYENDSRLKQANQYNLESAFNLSLILLALGEKSTVRREDLYRTIALLSYRGDPRMIVGGENPNKVKNIVKRQFNYFEQLYSPAMELALQKRYIDSKADALVLMKNPKLFAEILRKLPNQFKLRLAQSYLKKYANVFNKDSMEYGRSSFLNAVSSDAYLRRTLLNTVLAITSYPALVQSFKGILTAGIVKSTKYAWEKKTKSMIRPY